MLSTGILTIKNIIFLYYKNINIEIEQSTNREMNKIVASYDSLRCCQCDKWEEKQKNKTKTTKKVTHFRQAADVQWLSNSTHPIEMPIFCDVKK